MKDGKKEVVRKGGKKTAGLLMPSRRISISEADYQMLLETAVAQISGARSALAVQVNASAMSVYWNLGKLLHDRKVEGGYGSGVVPRLSRDLKVRFPEMGLSPRNMWNMKLFYERYAKSGKKLLQAVAVLRWGHNLLLLNKKLSDAETLYYASECAAGNWNRDMLLNAVKMNFYLSLLDKLEREERENRSIGIILCAEKDRLDVELALQDVNKPIAVSDYELFIPQKELQALVLSEMKAMS